MAILDIRKSLSIAISPFQINTHLFFFLFFFYKMATGGHFGWPKITFDRISHHSRSIRSFFWNVLQNGRRWPFWMTENHFGSHFSPFQINTQLFFFWIFLQNGRRWPFWKTENHFQSHFSPFQINTQLFFFFEFFYEMAAGHFGWPKITFDRISHHFRSIRNFFF